MFLGVDIPLNFNQGNTKRGPHEVLQICDGADLELYSFWQVLKTHKKFAKLA